MGARLSRLTLTRLVLLGSLTASACSFVLDFDNLQKSGRLPASGGASASGGDGTGPGGERSASGGVSAANGGTSASGGEPGAQAGAGGEHTGAAGESSNDQAGAAGAPPLSTGCSPDCVDLDDDPCTTVRCVDAGHGPECMTSPLSGLVLEADLPPIATPDPHQIALTTSNDEFLLSLWSQSEQGSKDAVIYRLAQARDATPQLATRISDLGRGEPWHAPVAVYDPMLKAVHVYFGVHDADVMGGALWHATFTPNFQSLLSKQVPVAGGYLEPMNANEPGHLPSAGIIRRAAIVSWLNHDGNVSLDIPDTMDFATAAPFAPTAGPASAVGLIATTTPWPAVVYTVPDQGVYIQALGGTGVLASDCQSGAGVYGGLARASTLQSGRWFTAWTKAGTDFLSTENQIGYCRAFTCSFSADCVSDAPGNNERNVAMATTHFDADPAGTIYYIEVTPRLRAAGTEAVVEAQVQRIDFDNNKSAPIGVTATLASQTLTADGERGPDEGAVAVIGRETTVAWVEPAGTGKSQVRLQRYALCASP